MKDKLTIGGVLLAVALGVVGLFSGDVTNVSPVEIRKEVVGANPGPDHRNGVEYFYDGLADGAGVFSTSTAGSGAVAGTLTAAQLEKNSRIEVTVNSAANMVLTLPATSTMSHILPASGMKRTWYIENATTTAATTLTIAKGAGINLIGVTTNDDVIDGTERSVLECQRRSDKDWDCVISELLDVD